MLKDEFRVFNLENASNSLIEVEPNPEKPDYVVVSKVRGVEGPNRCLRYNNDESVLLANRGDSITGMLVFNPKGVQKTNLDIKSESLPIKDTAVEFEDYVALGNNGIISGNNQGVIEGFEYNVSNGTHVRRYMHNINQGRPVSLYQQITSMALSDDQKYLLVATAIDNQRIQACLNSLMVFEIFPDSLNLVDVKEFPNSNADSMYFYTNFEYRYKDERLIFAYQGGDQNRLDAYSFKNGKIEHVHTVYNYHNGPYSAIRGMAGKIISVDYDGEMKLMSIPE